MDISKHKYVKLLGYAIAQKSSYHMEPGLTEANMTESEFEYIRDTLFINANYPGTPPGKSQTHDWRLKPEAVFGYLSFKQYEHAQMATRRALYISVASLTIAATTLIISVATVWL